MTDSAAEFIGSIPEEYDRGLGPVIFIDFAEAMAARVASFGPKRVLETAAGLGIVSHCLRVHLSPDAVLTVTGVNPPMLDVARRKFDRADRMEFQLADATDLPFSNDLYDAVVCQFGVMFFPDKDRSYREMHRVLRRIDVVAFEKQIGDLVSFARDLVFGKLLIGQLQSRGGVDPQSVAEAIQMALEREFPNGTMPLQAMVFEATKAPEIEC